MVYLTERSENHASKRRFCGPSQGNFRKPCHKEALLRRILRKLPKNKPQTKRKTALPSAHRRQIRWITAKLSTNSKSGLHGVRHSPTVESMKIDSQIERLLDESQNAHRCAVTTDVNLRRKPRRRCESGELTMPYPQLFARTEIWADRKSVV